MTEEELRARFDKEISAPDKKLVWETLQEDEWVSDACRGAIEWEDFEKEAITRSEMQRLLIGRTKLPGRSPRDDYFEEGLELTESEVEHAAALAPYLAKRVALQNEVKGFREANLGGGWLEPAQVTTFLRDELSRISVFEYAELEPYFEEADIGWQTGDEEMLPDLVGGSKNRGRASASRYLRKVFREAYEQQSMSIPLSPDEWYVEGVMRLVPDGRGGSLEDTARRLCSRYPWPLRDAAWFVLTDEPPEIEPVEWRQREDNGRYEISFAPWISERTVRRAIRAFYEGDNRPLTSKTLSAFRFVEDRTDPERTPKWADLRREWNSLHPDDRFWDGSALKRAHERARERLAPPWARAEYRAID